MISFNDFQMEMFSVLNGLDQGDPFLGICYLFYNADLLKIPVIKNGEHMLLYVDDTAIIVTSADFKEIHEKLRDIMNCSNRVSEWAKIHNCEFGIKKFQLLDITKKLIPHPVNPKKKIPTPCSALILGNQCILLKELARFLGVMVDNKLNWKGQYTTARARGQDWVIQFSRIAQALKGIHAKYF